MRLAPRALSRVLIPKVRSFRSRADRGYVIALTALLMLPLMVTTAFAVDVGAWQSRGAEMQRAADAAALAGVVELPDMTTATQKARQVATANGFDWSTARYDVDVSEVLTNTGDSVRLRVVIIDNEADQYFSSVIVDEFSITRQATAEFIKPVKMGSPKNFLGTGSELSGANRENFWLALSGYCASREQGERIAAVSDGNFTTNNNPPSGTNTFASCQPALNGGSYSYVERNPEYDNTGYFYAMQLDSNYSGTLRVEVFDGPYCTRSSSGAGDQSGAFNTVYRMRSNNSSNPITATVLSTWNANSGDGVSGCDSWRTLHTFTNPTAGTYYIQVNNSQGYTSQQGTNQFALRVREGSSFSPCTSDPTGGSSAAPYRANCPNLHGVENMGVFANFSGTSPSFFLADLGPEHNNKVMEIVMWDMGEGSQRLRILDPNGNQATYRWTVLCLDGSEPSGGSCPTETNPSGGRSGTSNNLDVSGTGNQPRAHRLSSSKYNDRLMRLEIQLPADITAAYGGRTWWRVQYVVDSAPSDRTTWSVIVRGDPVRLVPD